MRSFLLKDLIQVQSLFSEIMDEHDKSRNNFVSATNSRSIAHEDLEMHHNQSILSKNDIKRKYPLHENTVKSNWRYSFMVEFPERSFTLSARTKMEHDEWVRIFRIITRMNAVALSVCERNPYVFEDMELKLGECGKTIAIQASRQASRSME